MQDPGSGHCVPARAVPGLSPAHSRGRVLALASTEGRQSSPLHQPMGMGTERAQTSLFLHYMTETILPTGDSQLSSLS